MVFAIARFTSAFMLKAEAKSWWRYQPLYEINNEANFEGLCGSCVFGSYSHRSYAGSQAERRIAACDSGS
jgi:hypothetical protein